MCFFQSETLTLNSSRSLDYERGNESIIYFTDLFKPIETVPIRSYPAAKHLKHRKFAITDIQEKPVNFFLLFNTGVNFSLRNNFANSGSFGKVSVPVHNYNSLQQTALKA